MASKQSDPAGLRFALLVDRDDDCRERYAEYLNASAVETEQATDGRDGLAKALARQPDVVVTETRLSGIDGSELCALLRRDVATRTTPIIVMTEDGDSAGLDRARAAGADLVLVKPCPPETLLAEMRRLVRRAGELRAAASSRRPAIRAGQGGTRPLRARLAAGGRAMSRTFQRHETTSPPEVPPALVCPACDRPLVYRRSHIGGVNESHREQWDDFECPAGCGTFQYRQRTRALRKVC